MTAQNKPNLIIISRMYKGNKGKILNILRNYSKNILPQIENLKLSIQKRDVKKIKSIAHTLKSSLYYLGLTEIRKIAIEIEDKADNMEEITKLSTSVDFLLIEWKEIQKYLEKIINQLS